MGAFISKQPNGLYCRFSTIVDCPTDWNMTEEDYIELCAETAREEARRTLELYIQLFDKVKQHFYPTSNMSEMEFKKFLDDVGDN